MEIQTPVIEVAPGQVAHTPEVPSDVIVLFGATGDLAHKYIFPALRAGLRHGRIDLPVIATARSGCSAGAMKARARDSMEKHGGVDSATFDRFAARLSCVEGDYREPSTYARLSKALRRSRRPLHYLAIPPGMFSVVVENLARSGCLRDGRVVVEKPFGRDLASARELNKVLRSHLPEESIYRIDHYLGKEPVQNFVYFRFANPIVDSSWNKDHIESVQITMAEKPGVDGRGKFYDEVGAIRDVVQNHLLQVVACLAMECPRERGPDSLRHERYRLISSVRTLEPGDVVRSQFRGYRAEPGVDPASRVETFATLRLFIDNARWAGVPFHIRTGKCLPVTATEVLVRYRHPERRIFDDPADLPCNYYRFRVSPEMVVALGASVKRPGENFEGECLELIARHQPPDEMKPYERLLGDAAAGDPTLFAGQDTVEEAWRIVDPILGDRTPLEEYQPLTWGPPSAARLAPPGGWCDPEGSPGGKPH